MEIKRKVILSCLEKVMAVITTKSSPEHQVLNFYNGRLQATNGSVWIDTPLPEGLNLDFDFCVGAEPFYLLIKKLKDKDIDLEFSKTQIFVRAGKNTNAEFAIAPAHPAEIPKMEDSLNIQIKDMQDFITGLKFCRLGVHKDETRVPLCGVNIKDNSIWACDEYRILNWNLKDSTGLNCTIPVKLIDILNSFKDDIQEIRFIKGSNFGGCLGISLQDDMSVWAATLEGEYKDIGQFFPDDAEVEVVEFGEEFPDILDRHLGNAKDVKAGDKEVEFQVSKTQAVTISRKFVNTGGEKDRKLEEIVSLKSEGAVKDLVFLVNPVLLKDVVGLSLKFSYFAEMNVILFSTDTFRYLIRARG